MVIKRDRLAVFQPEFREAGCLSNLDGKYKEAALAYKLRERAATILFSNRSQQEMRK